VYQQLTQAPSLFANGGLEHAGNQAARRRVYKRSVKKADYMKLTNLTVALGVAGLLALGGVAHAFIAVSPTDTYEFTAAPGYTNAFNGSTITINGAGVTAFSFYDREISPTPFTTPIAVFDNNITFYDRTGWWGEFTVGPDFPYVFDATGNSMDEYVFAPAVVGADPPGTWTYVPDASSTFTLLLGVMAALVGFHHCNRPQRVLALVQR